MNYGWLLPLFLGIVLTFGGGMILFSKKGVDWMYKEGLWKVAAPFNKKSDRRFRRYISGTRLFVIGVILLVGSILGIILTLNQ